MTVPFWCLLVAIAIPYVLSTAGGVFRARQFGAVDNKNPRQQQARMEGVGARIQAAQANAWEALPVFGLSVLVAHLAGADPGTATSLALAFVACRVLHAVFYISDLDKLRSLSFLGGLACCVGLFVAAA